MKFLIKTLAVLFLMVASGYCSYGCGNCDSQPKISVFAHYVNAVAKQRNLSLEAAADKLYALGIRGFDTAFNDPRLSQLAKTSLKPINLYGSSKFLSADGGETRMDEFIGMAVKYGVPRIMVIPDSFTKDGDEATEFAKIVDGLKKAVAKAKALGITVTIEDFGGDPTNPCNRMFYLKRFLDEIPDIRLALDSGNLYYARRGEDIRELMRYAGKRIAHVHLKDQLESDQRTYTELGLGGVPNEEIVHYVAASGYDGWYTLENTAKGAEVYIDTVRQVAVLKTWVAEGVELKNGTTPRADAKRPLKVLAIGNSYAECLLRKMPQIAADLDLTLDLLVANIGGCSLEKHVRLMDDPKLDPHGRPCPWSCRYSYADGGRPNLSNPVWNHLRDAILADDWDVVTIQQASHDSWRSATYRPWGDNLVGRIRALRPDAEIVVQETWSDHPGSGRLAKWKLTSAEMYAHLHEAYADFVKPYGFRIIPTGAAVEKARTFGMMQKKVHDPHLNSTGEFLQGLVWTEKLFGVDVTRGTYVPEGMDVEFAKNLRAVAHETCKEAMTGAK